MKGRSKNSSPAETVQMLINTEDPESWRLVNTHSGHVYKWGQGHWVRVTEGFLAAWVRNTVERLRVSPD